MSMIKVNALGDACPIPVVKTKNAIKELHGAGEVETLVDNEIAVQNLTKMAGQKGYAVNSEKLEEGKYRVVMTISDGNMDGQEHRGDTVAAGRIIGGDTVADGRGSGDGTVADRRIIGGDTAAGGWASGDGTAAGGRTPGGYTAEDGGGNVSAAEQAGEICRPDARKDTLVAISSAHMGEGSDELGGILMKGFLYALTQQDELPRTILFYNGGAHLTCEGSDSLEDLKSLEAQGVEILTCGTCLQHYGLSEKLQVGDVTNMYVIAEKMTQASLVVKP